MAATTRETWPPTRWPVGPWRSRILALAIDCVVMAFFVVVSPARTSLDISFGDAAQLVLVEVLTEGIDPPIHWIGFILVAIGLVFATRWWGGPDGAAWLRILGWNGNDDDRPPRDLIAGRRALTTRYQIQTR